MQANSCTGTIVAILNYTTQLSETADSYWDTAATAGGYDTKTQL